MINVMDWLLEDDNPAVQYRTKTELLNEKADKQNVVKWINDYLPSNWQNTKGLWLQYYLTSIVECGLDYNDINFDKERMLSFEKPFECGCTDFMRLRALIMLGFFDEYNVREVLHNLKSQQLPDGGFLCLHRLKKLKYIPKSCVKSNNIALMLCAECSKRGINLDITDDLLSYFWKHNIFFCKSDLSTLILEAREGWRTIDTFYPFEVMRVGLQNILESFCALGFGNDERLKEAWSFLNNKKNENGQVILDGTLTKSYLPKERVGKPSKWVTFYSLLAEKKSIYNFQK